MGKSALLSVGFLYYEFSEINFSSFMCPFLGRGWACSFLGLFIFVLCLVC